VYSDEEIVKKVIAGDKLAYENIIERYQAKLVRYVSYLLKDNTEAEDVVQDTFIKAYMNLNSLNLSKKFSSWIYRIAHNESVNKLIKRKWISNFDFELFSTDLSVEEHFEKEEIKNWIALCLDKVDIKYKEPLVLYYLEDKSYDEISTILRIPVGTVGTRINRGKKLLKTICQTK